MYRMLALSVMFMVVSLSTHAVTGSNESGTVALETVSPWIDSVSAVTEQSLSVTFSEVMLTPGVSMPEHYAVSGLGAGTLASSSSHVTGSGLYTLSWDAGEMQNGATETVTAAGLQDTVGNPIDPARASASCAGLGVAPVFTQLAAIPSRACVGDTVAITFRCSEPLNDEPSVTVNGHGAKRSGKAKDTDFTFEYTVLDSDALGTASVSITGLDLAGNPGQLNNDAAFEIIEELVELPLYAWPAGLALLATGIVLLAWKRRLVTVLFMLALLTSFSVMAELPSFSGVTVQQVPNGGTTQVRITYGLNAPNGPCDVTVFLSKDDGADGYCWPVTSVTGDLADVNSGTAYLILWDIRKDYPEENIPNARIRLVADDGVIQHTLTYAAEANGSITGTSPQTINHGASGTQVTAVPDNGYGFVQWSDGVLTAARTDTNVTADVNVTASFALAPPVVTSFAINSGAATTMPLDVTLNDTTMNNPIDYMASESASFTGATWQPYVTASSFTLSFGIGVRTVYFKARNGTGESGVVSDTIFLVPNTVSVGAGTFPMGRTYEGDDCVSGGDNELPVHDVTLGAYQLGRGEVTNKEYCDVLNWALEKGYLKNSMGAKWRGTGDLYAGSDLQLIAVITASDCGIQYAGNVFTPKTQVGLPDTTEYSLEQHPMVWLTWYGSAAFCNWLSLWQELTPCYDMDTAGWPLVVAPPTSGGYRLPTEAEWERAAAWDGETHWIYAFMSNTNSGPGSNNRCNDYCDTDGYGYINPLGLTTTPYTSPVGWFDGVHVSPNGNVATVDSPSPVGAYDMSGNAYEWCNDWYSSTYYDGGSMTNPTGPSTGSERVTRGGSWNNIYFYCRTANRNYYAPTFTYQFYGFRIARS